MNDFNSRTGQNPSDNENYLKVHGSAPSGIRRWRFLCLDGNGCEVQRLEADGEYAHIYSTVTATVQQHVGDCTIVTHATSGPPRSSGLKLTSEPTGWMTDDVRIGWTD